MRNNPFSLEGKTVLITGASSGIGKETAIQCSNMGANVIVTARNEERLAETFNSLSGDNHRSAIADLTTQEELERLVDEIPVLNGVVLCAGMGMTAPFLYSIKEKFSELFDVNYFAPVELLRLLLKKKKIAKEGAVVFVSSVGGLQSFQIGNTIYGATKAAINSTMKFCAKELAPKKIRVNSVNPAMVNTKLIQGGAFSEEQLQTEMEKYPLKRFGDPKDIAYGIIYLLSDAASWVTGHALIIDGGKTLG